MRTYDFSIQNTPTSKEENYVTFKAGKGKSDNSVIYVPYSGFSFLEGIIWDKFREYDNSRKAKIASHEWNRIIEGFQTSYDKLKSLNNVSEMKKVLKFEIFQSEYPLEDISNQCNEIVSLLEHLIKWISEFTTTEKHITITKKVY